MNNDIKARETMYRLAKERGLLPQIIMLCADARKEGGKIGSEEWTIHGLLQYLGFEIVEKHKIKCPVLNDDSK